MLDDDLLVVGFDLEAQREVHVGDRPLEQWRALGYGRRESVGGWSSGPRNATGARTSTSSSATVPAWRWRPSAS
ncbi:hypothetical protein [Streptomyces sp. NPDC048644]|uniref:hypothetical protein n=1 Tax=Streptomyces sp. NPDC048644 TaxID=3365582 RepID=UPI0037120009